MKYTELELENKLSQIDFSEELNNDKMLNNLLGRLNGGKIRKKSRKFRNILVAAVAVTMIFMLMAFTPLGNILESLIFNGFVVNRVDSLGSSLDGGKILSSWSFKTPDIQRQPIWGTLEDVYFDTLEEAAEHLAFTPAGLSYLPEGYSFKNVIVGMDGRNRYYKNECKIRYESDSGSDRGANSIFTLSARYVGKNATIEITTTGNIEKIILSSGIEALLMTDFEVFLTDENRIAYHYTIVWIKDGIGYSAAGIFDREEIIKMAESVG